MPAPVFASPLKVDEEAGIIYRVKILGWESRNGRRYVPEAVQKKLHLYDGAKAFCDHPDKATDTRGCDEALGVWRKPVVESDGAYADLHYFKTHPLAARVVEDAKRGLGVFGASHNADGEGTKDQAGIFVVQDILEVRSVDLVTDAGTVTNLWESKINQTTLRALLEGLAVSEAVKAAKVALLEDLPAEMGDMAMEPAPAAEDWRATLGRVAGDLMAKDDAEAYEIGKKIAAMLKPEGSAETTTEGDDDDEEEEKKKMPEGRKGKQIPGTVTLTEARAKQFCTLAGLDPAKEKPLLEAMTATTEDGALKLLEWAKGKTAPPKPTHVPRSQGPGSAGAGADDVPTDRASFLKRLRPTNVVSA